MKHMLLPVLVVMILLTSCAGLNSAARLETKAVAREVPRVAPGHPGNVFFEGEELAVSGPAGISGWRIADETGRVVKEGKGDRVAAPGLGVGWYRVEYTDAQGAVAGSATAAVLAPLKHPVPQDSPICMDSASAWFARDDAAKQERFTQLAALLGINWIRDRMSWRQMEPQKGAFAQNTTYDSSADIQARYGMKVLQVFHDTPEWAAQKDAEGKPDGGRFPEDLRDHFDFCKAMAQRYRGRVLAWEPWNEANIDGFGGHTIDEMCSLQKAAYWGLKAGDPDIIVCWNVFAGGGSETASDGVLRNEAWPYFETYNVHTYDPPEGYDKSFAYTRNAASGRPIWLSECGIGQDFVENSAEGALTPELELRQASFLPRSYASSLFVGIDRHFFFILGNYLERGKQFGLLNADQTPRPGYVAMAAVGRFLAGAKCLGRLPVTEKQGPHVYAFQSKPDGMDRDVLIAWALEAVESPLPKDLKVEAAYDYLGRPCAVPTQLSDRAVYLVLSRGTARRLPLEPLSAAAPFREGSPSPVVMQIQMPAEATNLANQAHKVTPGEKTVIPMNVYNFSDGPVSGSLCIEDVPTGWQIDLGAKSIQVDAFGRIEVPINATIPSGGEPTEKGGWVTLRGDFGSAGRPVLAFRLIGANAKTE